MGRHSREEHQGLRNFKLVMVVAAWRERNNITSVISRWSLWLLRGEKFVGRDFCHFTVVIVAASWGEICEKEEQKGLFDFTVLIVGSCGGRLNC